MSFWAEAYTGNEEPEKAADAYLRGYQALNESTLKKSAMDAYLKLGDEAKARRGLRFGKGIL